MEQNGHNLLEIKLSTAQDKQQGTREEEKNPRGVKMVKYGIFWRILC